MFSELDFRKVRSEFCQDVVVVGECDGFEFLKRVNQTRRNRSDVHESDPITGTVMSDFKWRKRSSVRR